MINVACSPLEDETSSHPKQYKRNVKFLIFCNQHVTFCPAEIMTDTFESDLHIIEHGSIHHHVVKQSLHFQVLSIVFIFSLLHTYNFCVRITECVSSNI